MKLLKAIALVLLLGVTAPADGTSRWGADYFPNVSLTTHQGETVQFFEDLIKDKVVVINFIYTICPDTCPLETARLAKVQKILGDRVGKDIFMYSITIDPDNDTPEVLAKYAQRYRAQPGWLFLTGKESDIIHLRRKLGLYLEEIQEEDSNNHNLSLIIGNQKTGKWMKRSPFENPYVLATHIGSWLTGWQAPPEETATFENVPDIRQISQGEILFRTRCAACHTIGGGEEGLAPGLVGPDLLNVTKIRDKEWLARWIAVPDKVLEEKDPIAMGLYYKYQELPMPNMRLSRVDVRDVVKYLGSESRRVNMDRAREKNRRRKSSSGAKTSTASTTKASDDSVAIMNAWVREAHPDAEVNAAYMTLVNVGSEDVTLVQFESPAYESVEMHEMTMGGGMMKMSHLPKMVVAAGSQSRLEPGGKHLMLKGPKEHLVAGQNVDLTLIFESGQRQTISVKVADQ